MPVHQPVELRDVDANGAVAGALPAGLLLRVDRIDHVLRLHGSILDQIPAHMPRVSRVLPDRRLDYVAGLGLVLTNENVAEVRSRLRQGVLRRFPIHSRGSRTGFLLGLEQTGQGGDQFLVVALPFVASGFNAAEDLADRVHHGQQRGGACRSQRELPIAQARQQAFSYVRYRFELVEGQKTRSALDGVDSTENAGHGVAVAGILFESDQILIKSVQILVTLH